MEGERAAHVCLGDVVFCSAYGVLRMGAGFNWAALAVTLLEIGVTLTATATAFGIGRVLRRNAALAGPYRIGAARVKAAREVHRRLERALLEVEEARAAAQEAIARREDATRRHDSFQKLALNSARARYAVLTAKLVAEAAKLPVETAMLGALENVLAAAIKPGVARHG
jgi:hypothetical protein